MVGIQCEFHSSFCLRTFRSSKYLVSFAQNVPRNASRSVCKLNLYIFSMEMKIEMAGQVLVKFPILNSVYIHEMGLELFSCLQTDVWSIIVVCLMLCMLVYSPKKI
jgi:hypothetical protein